MEPASEPTQGLPGTPDGAAAPGDATSADPEPYDCLAPAEGPGELGRLERYRVLRALGSGGMGVVFEAEDTGLGRKVALKVMRPGFAASAAARGRFLREARAMAVLEHDNVARVYRAGEDRGHLFLAMQLLRGESLDERLRRPEPLPLAEALRIGREAAEGLAAAHAHGLIHRDVKPANVWLESKPGEPGAGQGEPGASATGAGRVKLLDFGLARAAAGDVNLTQTGAVLGTPGYMAPEQIDGHEVDHRCDLFSLGCLLYRMCTGRPAFAGATPMAVLRAVAVDQPLPPRQVNPRVPELLSELILALLEKDPELRPESAGVVADTLEALEAEDTAPRRAPRRRWAWAAGLALLAALAGGAALVHGMTDEDAPPDPGPGTQAVATPLDGWDRAKLPAGVLAWADWDGAGEAPAALVGFLGEPQLRYVGHAGWPAYGRDGRLLAVPSLRRVTLFDAATGLPVRALDGHGDKVYRAAFSPDGKTLATAGLDRTVRLWDVATGKVMRVLAGHHDKVTVIAFSPDGLRLASASHDLEVRVWGAETGEGKVLPFRLGEKPFTLEFHPGGNSLLVRTNDGLAQVLDLAGQEGPRSYSGVLGFGTAAYSPDGGLVAVGDRGRVTVYDTTGKEGLWTAGGGGEFAAFPDGASLVTAPVFSAKPEPRTAKVWEARTGKVLRTVPLDSTQKWVLYALAPDGQTLAAVDENAEASTLVRQFDLLSGAERPPPAGHADAVVAVAVSPDGRTAATGGKDDVIRLWDLATGKQIRVLAGHKGDVRYVAYSPDGKLLASCGWDGLVKLWDAARGRCLRTLREHEGKVERVAFSPDGRLLASCGWDGTAVVCDVRDGSVRQVIEGHEKEVWHVAFSPDGSVLATASLDGTARFWDAASGKPRGVVRGNASLNNVVFLPDGRTVALAGNDREVSLWDWQSGVKKRTLLGPGEFLHHLALRPDGRVLAACGFDGSVHLWDLAAEGRYLAVPLHPHREWIGTIAYTPDGKHLLAAGHDGLTYVLRPPETLPEAKYGPVRVLRGHEGHVHSVAVLPDGRALTYDGAWNKVTPGTNRVRVWDLATGAEKAVHSGPSDYFWNAAFLPDGSRVLTGGTDGALHVWDFVAGREPRALLGHQGTVFAVALSADGSRALSGGKDGIARVWDVVNRVLVCSLVGHNGTVVRGTLSADGRRALTASQDGSVRLWDVPSGKQLWRADTYPGDHNGVCLSPDGRRAAWQQNAGSVTVRDAATGKEERRMPLPDQACQGLAFSPDGRRLLACGRAGILTLWDVDSGRVLFRARTAATEGIAFAPDGRHALTGHKDGTVSVWRLPEAAP